MKTTTLCLKFKTLLLLKVWPIIYFFNTTNPNSWSINYINMRWRPWILEKNTRHCLRTKIRSFPIYDDLIKGLVCSPYFSFWQGTSVNKDVSRSRPTFWHSNSPINRELPAMYKWGTEIESMLYYPALCSVSIHVLFSKGNIASM